MKEGSGCCWHRSSYWGTDGDGRRGGRRERRNDAGQDVGWGGNDWLVNAVEVTRASTLTVQWLFSCWTWNIEKLKWVEGKDNIPQQGPRQLAGL